MLPAEVVQRRGCANELVIMSQLASRPRYNWLGSRTMSESLSYWIDEAALLHRWSEFGCDDIDMSFE